VTRPVSVKGVYALDDRRVLLCHNHRGDWELPGGRPDEDESDQDCLIREFWEETGLAVRIDRPLGTVPYEVMPDRWVDVIGYACSVASAGDPPGSLASLPSLVASDEHVEVAFVDPDTLEADKLPLVYRALIARAAAR